MKKQCFCLFDMAGHLWKLTFNVNYFFSFVRNFQTTCDRSILLSFLELLSHFLDNRVRDIRLELSGWATRSKQQALSIRKSPGGHERGEDPQTGNQTGSRGGCHDPRGVGRRRGSERERREESPLLTHTAATSGRYPGRPHRGVRFSCTSGTWHDGDLLCRVFAVSLISLRSVPALENSTRMSSADTE